MFVSEMQEIVLKIYSHLFYTIYTPFQQISTGLLILFLSLRTVIVNI